MKGHAIVYKKNHINTDDIIPAIYLDTTDNKELARHAMENFDPKFVKKVKPGDILIAGTDFGCGSSREHAVLTLREAGIQAVIANSFARIFYRNSINNGFLAIECKDIEKHVTEGDELEINVNKGKIINLTKKEEYDFTPMPKFAMNIINSGGLLKYIRNK